MSRPSPWSHAAIPLLVLGLGLAAAFFAWRFSDRLEQAEFQQAIERRGEHAAESLASFLEGQIDVLRFVQSYYRNRQDASEADLEALLHDTVARDPRYSTLVTVVWAVPVDPGDRAAFAAAERAIRPQDPGYELHDFEGKPVSGPARSLVVRHAWSVGSEDQLHGLDLASVKSLAEARLQAVTSGEARVAQSAPLPVSGPTAAGDGFAVVLPVFPPGPVPREEGQREDLLRGCVVGFFDRGRLFAAGLAEDPPSGQIRLLVRVTAETEDELLYEHGPKGGPVVTDRRFQASVCGQSFLLDVQPGEEPRLTTGEFLERPSVLLPPTIFVVLLLCAWIVWTILRQNAVIQSQVQQRTGELRQKNLVLERKERELNDLNQRLLEMSNTDPLTGILNRRAFEVQLDRERERSKRLGVPYGLLIFDIDFFKDFNDRYGHALGDEVLKRVAQIIHNEARRIDCVARYGGEEFVVLASGADANGLMALGERIRSRVQEAAIENASSAQRVLTVSGGGALSSASETGDARMVFEIADRCLYQAKSTGRNRVVMVM